MNNFKCNSSIVRTGESLQSYTARMHKRWKNHIADRKVISCLSASRWMTMPEAQGFFPNGNGEPLRVDGNEVYAYGDVGPWDSVNFDAVFDAVKSVKNERPLVRIDSEGGSVFEGFAIYRFLEEHGVDTVVDARGFSIASVLMLAGEQRSIAELGRVMIHLPSAVALGSADDLRQVANLLEDIGEDIAKVFAQRTTIAKPYEKMQDETWYNAQQAIENGFAQKIYAEDDKVTLEPATAQWGNYQKYRYSRSKYKSLFLTRNG